MAQAEHVVARNVVALADPPARTRQDEDDEDAEFEHWTAEQVGQFLDYVDAATVDGKVVERRKSRKGRE